MDAKTRETFGRICYGVPKQKRGHVPTVRTVGRQVTCACSCGDKKPRSFFGNTAGWGYAVAECFFWYLGHTNQEVA